MPLIHKEVSPHGDWIIYMNGVPLYKKWPTGHSALFDKYGPPISNRDRDAMPHGGTPPLTMETSAVDPFQNREPDALAKMIVRLLSGRSSDAAFIERTARLFVIAADALHWKDFANLAVFTTPDLRDHLNLRTLVDCTDLSRFPDMPVEVRSPIRLYLDSIPGFVAGLGYRQPQQAMDWHAASEMELTALLGSLYNGDEQAVEPLRVAEAIYPDGDATWVSYLLRGISTDEAAPVTDAPRGAAPSDAPSSPFKHLDRDALPRMISSLVADDSSDVEVVARATHLFVVAHGALHWKQDEKLGKYGIPELRDHLNLKVVIDLADPAVYPTMPTEISKPIQEYLRTLHAFRPEMGYKQAQTTLDEHGVAEMQLTKLLGSLYDTYSYLFEGSAIEDPYLSDPFWIPKRLKMLEEARVADPIPNDIIETASNLDYMRGGPSSIDIADAIFAERKRWQEEIARLTAAAKRIEPHLKGLINEGGHVFEDSMHDDVKSFLAAFHLIDMEAGDDELDTAVIAERD